MKPLVALVTGGSRGIGRGISIALARAGYSVAINYVHNESSAIECRKLCREAAPQVGLRAVEIVHADISTGEGRRRLVADVFAKFGWIDLLVNNAGIAPPARRDLLETTEDSFDLVMDTNAKAPFFLTQAVANVWLSRLGTLEHGRPEPRIVTISSVSAYAPGINRAEYCMSKAALSMMTQLFAVRLAEHGIGVYEVRPGVIRTDMTREVQEKYDRMIDAGLTPIKRWGTPEDVGLAVVAIAENSLPFSTGEVLNVDGGFHIRVL
ncbi:MAG TPA: 3-ketoacyl-ACP reductase [Terriglobia bacterium]|nr:3-ketoacyl-ACP reductase [Terriglobia bacterium]